MALLIVLVYAIAALLFASSSDRLTPSQGWLLVLFIVTFPLFVLAALAWLVARHHTKLYAPTDFRDEDTFIRALRPLTAEEEKNRLLTEHQRTLELEASSPAAREDAREGRPDSGPELRSEIWLARELGIRAVAFEYGVMMTRQVVVAGDVQVDGVFHNEDGFHAVEVKFIRDRGHAASIVQQAIERAGRLATRLRHWSHCAYILVFVHEGLAAEDIQRVREEAGRRINSQSQARMRVIIHDLEKLRKEYGPG